jgi:hypothetical protein
MGNNQNTYFEENQKKQKMDERTNNDLITNDHGYVPLVVSNSRFFPHS